MLKLWTDGSAFPNPGPGGFAVILEQENGSGKPVILGREARSTNIRMEGLAIAAAIRGAKGRPCEIHTDSVFWVNVLTRWAPGWKRRGWHREQDKKIDEEGRFVGWEKSSIKNLKIVQELYGLYRDNSVELVWERGHVGTKYNEMADKWAKKARRGRQLNA